VGEERRRMVVVVVRVVGEERRVGVEVKEGNGEGNGEWEEAIEGRGAVVEDAATTGAEVEAEAEAKVYPSSCGLHEQRAS
jgi:hypothetical protein